MNFKESPFMYGLAALVIVFVLAQSAFFLYKAWKQGKKLGLTSQTMRSTVTSSILFSISERMAVFDCLVRIKPSDALTASRNTHVNMK